MHLLRSCCRRATHLHDVRHTLQVGRVDIALVVGRLVEADLGQHLVPGGQVLEVGVAAGGSVPAHSAVRVVAVVHLELQVRADLALGVGYVVEEGL